MRRMFPRMRPRGQPEHVRSRSPSRTVRRSAGGGPRRFALPQVDQLYENPTVTQPSTSRRPEATTWMKIKNPAYSQAEAGRSSSMHEHGNGNQARLRYHRSNAPEFRIL
jgi:hypothetical protein